MTFKQYMKRAWPLYVMIVPGVIFVLLFRYYPMYGVVIAFQDFSPGQRFRWIRPGSAGRISNFCFPCRNSAGFSATRLIISVAKIVMPIK